MTFQERKKILQGRIDRAHRIGETWPIHDPKQPFDHLGLFPGGNRNGQQASRIYPHYYDNDQLYDLDKDPLEEHNLANDPKYVDQLNVLKEELAQYLQKVPGTFGEFKK